MHDHDVLIIGSGFGGSLAAYALEGAGLRVGIVERGRWVERGPGNWEPGAAAQLSEHYTEDVPWHVTDDHGTSRTGGFFCVGGPSVFYGGVSLRFRVEDFEPHAEVTGDSGAEWPFRYADLEPHYSAVEGLIGVAGSTGEDPTEPWRSEPFPEPPGELVPISERLQRAARGLGLHPFRLPVAINYARAGRTACIRCGTCDGFACAISAKNDLATTVLGPLTRKGVELIPATVALGLEHDGRRITGLRVADAASGEIRTLRARHYILAAGSLATPHLLLDSGLAALNPAGDAVGRYLMRHCNRIVFGLFARPPEPEGRFHKQLAIHDLYLGDPAGKGPPGRLGGIQQLVTPPISLVRTQAPKGMGPFLVPLVSRITGFLSIAEDQPQYRNRVAIGSGRDAFGMPSLDITHHYSDRDEAAVRRLADVSRAILRKAGALAFYRHRIWTFSHALGTVRMGRDPRTAPLDADCRFRGVANLSVMDGSALPTSAGVNPSLTIAANALRAATALAAELRAGARDALAGSRAGT
ncbi:MAG TPA: GMC family oxidoreductase [Gemmatimonadales bacterium]|nr:GMC family oxidoreductase [Gemmatimonadales bacterium]